ncbi:MAG: dihydrodipicolinate synthase family protein [Terriglobia bacterium]
MASTENEVRQVLKRGIVIPAHPLALNASRKLDERRQRALTRYYCDAGAGGVAVGVHTTQFAIREPKIGLLEPVLALAAETVCECERALGRPILKIAGVCGVTAEALREAELARRLGYDAGLLSLSALRDASVPKLIEHCRAVAGVIPLFGFYLQPAVGGRVLPVEFWRRFVEIEDVVAVKVAPFNRYQTLDVVRALAESGRQEDVALYTGNDDNIVADLLTEFRVGAQGRAVALRFAGGLLGHWAVWTRRAVELLACIQESRAHPEKTAAILARSAEVTDSNAALFDAAGGFAGCIAGLHEILRRQGFLEGRWCLDPGEDLSPGQMEEIDRVCAIYPHLTDDEFVASNLQRWLG